MSEVHGRPVGLGSESQLTARTRPVLRLPPIPEPLSSEDYVLNLSGLRYLNLAGQSISGGGKSAVVWRLEAIRLLTEFDDRNIT